jgi:hypothetical protein
MDVRGCIAALCAGLCAASGCAAPTGPEEPPPELVRQEVMDVNVDSLDVIHGALRIVATMADGSADASVALGGRCVHREVGGGVSTATTLVWALEEREVADAIDCGLTVHARTREDGQPVDKVADLAVAVELTSSEPDAAGDSPPAPALAGIEVAQSVLHGRPLRSEGRSYEASLSIGGTQVEGAGEPEQVQPEEPSVEDPPGQDEIEIEGPSPWPGALSAPSRRRRADRDRPANRCGRRRAP